ncbi:hypothetical protein BABINDRAFT_6937 [Babjeviella inositovora NRRL Y-12698]|uniref:Vesicular-fusion protein SEC17 n=1 Tax=Babjeviella inositovora NRRL Y-12698 TaxID=984486 RepID=A0A1E3QTU2_9ASCO|nr:uncharacterized protein BABINDRAFT_6937 [Babjeviella inositovora NRRL Y-12698]ODQ81098.1 hypothetical protein BABINDRAFT_6937 [Babjeviella inositovora NRRL Y-12698]
MDPQELIRDADKKASVTSGGFLSSFFGSSSLERYEEATDLYTQAANMYKVQKNYSKAGDAFVKAAACQKKAENANDNANCLIDAFKCFKQSNADLEKAIQCLEEAIQVFLLQGQFRRAANFEMDLAELYETMDDLARAAHAYEQAGDWFAGDSAQALANKAYLKCADFKALLGEYQPAIKMYGIIIENSLGNNLSKWSLKDYFLKVVLCNMAQEDIVGAQNSLNKFLADDGSFESTREYKLAVDIVEAFQQGDSQLFTDKVYEYDQFSKLDKIKTQLLVNIKKLIAADEDDLT